MSPHPPVFSLSLCHHFVNIHSDHSNHRIGSPRFQMIVRRKLKGNDTIMTQTACCILASTMLYNDWYISTSTYLLIYCLLHLVWTIIWPNLFLLPVYRARCSSPHNADHPSLLTYLPCVNIITATRSSHSLPRTRNRLDSGHDPAALSLLQISSQKDILVIGLYVKV